MRGEAELDAPLHEAQEGRSWYGARGTVGITLSRKLQAAGLFDSTPTPTVDDLTKVFKKVRGKCDATAM